MLANTELKKEDKNKANAFFFYKHMEKESKRELIVYLLILVAIILIRSFIITPVRVSGSSMDNTLHDGEILFLNKINYRFNDIKRFDIVVIYYNDDKLIKRVIGLPGETLEYKDNKLYINGEVVDEPFLEEETEDYLYEGKIKDNCYFAVGDNRSDSLDSRYFGCFDKDNIEGKVSFALFPFKDFGKIN